MPMTKSQIEILPDSYYCHFSPVENKLRVITQNQAILASKLDAILRALSTRGGISLEPVGDASTNPFEAPG